MIKFTANDLRALANILSQFDKMTGQFRGNTLYGTESDEVVNAPCHYDPEMECHVITFNVDAR